MFQKFVFIRQNSYLNLSMFGSIPCFSDLLDETLNQGPVSKVKLGGGGGILVSVRIPLVSASVSASA